METDNELISGESNEELRKAFNLKKSDDGAEERDD